MSHKNLSEHSGEDLRTRFHGPFTEVSEAEFGLKRGRNLEQNAMQENATPEIVLLADHFSYSSGKILFARTSHGQTETMTSHYRHPTVANEQYVLILKM